MCLLRSLLDELLCQILASCSRGRVVRQRVAMGFKCAAALGLEAVEAYVALQPWEVKGKQPGRPQNPW